MAKVVAPALALLAVRGCLGDLALLPPVFSRDPTAPILLPVGYIGELWLNDIFNTPVDAGSSGLGKLHPTISRLACCCQEVVAGKTLVDCTEEERVVYPPAMPAPKEDAANEPDNDADNDPADDKSEHDDESDKNATPKKEEDESEDESDDESKAPKDQTAVSRDSGLGTSSSNHSVGTGTSVGALVINPSISHDTSMPLRTWLPSMQVLEELANDLYAYSGELFWGLEETSMAMLDRILFGFKRLGGHAWEYIHETAAIAINFFSKAGIGRRNWSPSEALKFCAAVNGMKESIRDLVRWTALAEESYEDAAAQFDNILSSISDELKEFVEAQVKSSARSTSLSVWIRLGDPWLSGWDPVHPNGGDERDYTPRLGIESEDESVTDSPPNYDLTYAHAGDHHGRRVEIHGIPVKAGVGA